MPGSTLPNTGVVLPSLGGDAGTWGTEVNAALTNYDGHNHTTGAGAAIPVAALNVNADIPFSSLYGPTAMARAQFSAVAAPSVPANNLSFFVSNGTGGLTAGELYWRNNTGNFIRVTSGNSLNFAAFVGGIGGDYTAVGASEAFDDSQKQYTFKDGAAKWARLHAGNVRLAPFGGTSVNFIEMAAPAGLATNYSLTWPATLPGAAAIAQVDNTGVWSFTNTVTQSINCAAIAASGLITANLGLIAGANQKVRVSGTGSFPHGTFTMSLPNSLSTTSTGGQYAPSTTGLLFGAASNGLYLIIPIPVNVGKRITAVRLFIRGNGASATLVANLGSTNSLGGTSTLSTSNTSVSSATSQTLLMSGLTVSVQSTTSYNIYISSVTPGTNNIYWGGEVDYDEP